jgi:ankyrin repeat protein
MTQGELNKNLLSAAKNGEIEQVNALILQGADINAVDEKNDSALHLAVRAGNFTIVTSLLLAKANINTPNKNGDTPLCIASSVAVIDSYDRITILQDLINNGAEVNKANPKDGMSPLQIAAENGQAIFVELLLKNGAEIGVNKKNGETALSYAIENNRKQVINILLNQADPDGYKPIHLAIISNPFKKENFEFLLTKVNVDEPTKNEEKKTPLHIAICHKNLEAVKCLLAIKTNFNTQDEKKDLNIPDENGNTPLHLATLHCLESIVKDLLDAGAKYDVRNNYGETAFDIAEKQNIGKIMKVFESQTNITSETEKQSQPKAPQAVSNKTPPLSTPARDDQRISVILSLQRTLDHLLKGVSSSIGNQVNAGGDIGGASARSDNKAPASHDKSEARQKGDVETDANALTMIKKKEATAIQSLLMLSNSAQAGGKEQSNSSTTPSSTLTKKRKGEEKELGEGLKRNKSGGKGQ